MKIPSNTRQLLHNMQHPATPLLDVGGGILIKHEALGLNPVHKCRSAAWLWERHLDRYGMPKGVTDRSSGSWAVANAIIAGACRLPSRFVTVGDPHPVVRELVESHGGEFVVVQKNAERRAQLQCLRNKGWWSPDQHNNLELVRAFAETLGRESANDLHRAGIDPKNLRYVVGAVGTGGGLAGLAVGLRADGFNQFEAVGCDTTVSMASSGLHSPPALSLPVPGVGSGDEVCRTLREARKSFPGPMIRINPLLAAEAAAQFRYIVARGCGMSSGLVLAAARRDLVPKLHSGEKILLLFSDDAGRYGPQLKSVAYAATP